jgi:RpiB/LacA/LacB family sugar-phosphate isomerase
MNIAIGSDHAGFELKKCVRALLLESGHEVVDLGTHNTPRGLSVFRRGRWQSGSRPRGIVICGSGVGASVAANKIRGIRAGLCHDTYSAHQIVEHNHRNMLMLGGQAIGERYAVKEPHQNAPEEEKGKPTKNPLKTLHEYGQYGWMDYIRRSFIASGELKRLVKENGAKLVAKDDE